MKYLFRYTRIDNDKKKHCATIEVCGKNRIKAWHEAVDYMHYVMRLDPKITKMELLKIYDNNMEEQSIEKE